MSASPADPSGSYDTDARRAEQRRVGQSSTGRPGGGVPKWVLILAAIGLLAVVLVVVMLAAGHGPGQHMGSGHTSEPLGSRLVLPSR